MKDTYFVITSSEDGLSISPLTKEELNDRLNPTCEDDVWYGDNFLGEIPDVDGFCLNMDAHDTIIIKGRIIQPELKKMYKLE